MLILSIVILWCIFIIQGCFSRFTLEFLGNGARLFINGEEYIDEFSDTTWIAYPDHNIVDWEYIGKVKASERNKSYKIYQCDQVPLVFLVPISSIFNYDDMAHYSFRKKDMIFPELTIEQIASINLRRESNGEWLRAEYNTDVEIISKVLEVIKNSSLAENYGYDEFDLTLKSNKTPTYISWHKVSKNDDGQYFIQVAPGNNYAPIPLELLEEIIGGPLPE
jgi:hypothetical protein